MYMYSVHSRQCKRNVHVLFCKTSKKVDKKEIHELPQIRNPLLVLLLFCSDASFMPPLFFSSIE